jgi:ribosomal-protein-alanine N-acetyltransferase
MTATGSPGELQTERCLLRPVASGDTVLLHHMWITPGVRRYLWDDEIIPIERARDVVEQSERLFRERAFGLWGVWLLSPRSLIGFAGLWPFRDPPELELVYGLAESHWGHGYATEAARAVIEYCFAALDLPAVRASTDAGNTASVRVLDRLGFSFERRAVVAGLDTMFYELTRSRGARGEGAPASSDPGPDTVVR